jgi:hypothetical protein
MMERQASPTKEQDLSARRGTLVMQTFASIRHRLDGEEDLSDSGHLQMRSPGKESSGLGGLNRLEQDGEFADFLMDMDEITTGTEEPNTESHHKRINSLLQSAHLLEAKDGASKKSQKGSLERDSKCADFVIITTDSEPTGRDTGKQRKTVNPLRMSFHSESQATRGQALSTGMSFRTADSLATDDHRSFAADSVVTGVQTVRVKGRRKSHSTISCPLSSSLKGLDTKDVNFVSEHWNAFDEDTIADFDDAKFTPGSLRRLEETDTPGSTRSDNTWFKREDNATCERLAFLEVSFKDDTVTATSSSSKRISSSVPKGKLGTVGSVPLSSPSTTVQSSAI